MNLQNDKRVVFVGNIPFDRTEEQLIEVFQDAGPVESFRLVFDRETGKPKGYGFCEFVDADTAASAIRNLNGYDLGGRKLRVDRSAHADNQRQGAAGGGSGGSVRQQQHPPMHNQQRSLPPQQQQHQQHQQQQQQQQQYYQNNKPYQPPPVQPVQQAPIPSINRIRADVDAMPQEDQYKLIKELQQTPPDKLRESFLENPVLAYSIFHLLMIRGYIPNDMAEVILQRSNANPLSRGDMPPPQMHPPPMPHQRPPMANMAPPTNYGHPQAGPPPQQASIPPDTEQQRALLEQLLAFPDEQINALPLDQQQQIRQLKAGLFGQAQMPPSY